MLLGLTCGLAVSTAAFTTTGSILVAYAEEGGLTEEELAELEAQAAAQAEAEAAAAAAAQAEAEAAAAAAAQAEAEAAAAAAAAQAEAEAEAAPQTEAETEVKAEEAQTEAQTESETTAGGDESDTVADSDDEGDTESSGLIDISGAEVSGIDASYAYTGNSIEPDPVVVVNGVTIGRDVDYVLSYEDNVNVGNAIIRISGQGNYVGEITVGFSIVGTEEEAAAENAVSTLSFTVDGKEYTNIADAGVSGIDAAYVYTGEKITPSPVLTLGEETLKEGSAYSLSYGENVEVGEGTVTISGIQENGYIGDISLSFSILETKEEAKEENEDPSKTNIKEAEVTKFEETYSYTGEAIEPQPVLTLDDKTLEEGTDYDLSYGENTELGIGSFTISGEGDYVGSVTYYFAIEEPEDEGEDPEKAKKDEEEKEEESEEEEELSYEIIGFSVDPNAYPAADASANTRYIYNYLTKTMGLNHAAACGVLANIQMESGFNPLALGDGGTSYGICQWHNERFNSLISYCNSIGLDYNTLDGQLANLNRELSGAYSGILAYIRSVPNTAQGAYDAGYYWCVNFEIPNDAASHGALRGNLAANNYFPLDLDSEEEIVEEEEEDPITTLRTDMSLQSDGWVANAEEDGSEIFTFTQRVLTNSAFE